MAVRGKFKRQTVYFYSWFFFPKEIQIQTVFPTIERQFVAGAVIPLVGCLGRFDRICCFLLLHMLLAMKL